MAESKKIEGKLVGAPKWTNPLVGYSAVISAAVEEYGPEAMKVTSDAFVRLGNKTGEYMIEQGLVPRGCNISQWGRNELEILEMTGSFEHEVIQEDADNFVIRLPDCGYQEPFRYMNAPREICSVPWCWDEGELQTVNPELHLDVAKCAYRGDDCCIFHVTRQRRG